MARRILLLNAVLALVFLPVMAEAVNFGDTPDMVRAELGSPNGTRSVGNREIWVYMGDITLEFEEGELVRAKGMVLEGGEMPVQEAIVRESPPPVEVEAVPEPSPEPVLSEEEQLVEELPSIEDARALAEQLEKDISGDLDDLPQSSTLLATILDWAIPIFLQFIFLVIAFKCVGAEAMKGALLVIAIIDQLIVVGVQTIFYNILEFPTTFHADTLVSIIVMLVLITKMTHAKQLPTAIKVVIASKVAGFFAFWLLAMFVLGSLG